ncbi:MAG: TrkH family potassium uptake protein [Candidatus Aenigmarchaeota archaeon]|nr:TrkH family potassium uptake protein [Candidatus Aenigmarchaeota archaeon]
MRPVLSNLGFVMQIAGIFLLLPVASAFYLGETEALISFFVAGFCFFILGFMLNALSRRSEISYKQSCILLSSSFFILSLIGSVPYLWNNPFGQENAIDRFTNSFFESASGFTTTGLSLIPDMSAVPRSLALYRSLTELIGGLGIVFLILAFFYKGNTIHNISRIIGLVDISKKDIKRSFASILVVYISYLAALTGAFYLLGFANLFDAAALMISGLMTGGFSPVNSLSAFVSFPGNVLIIVSMLLGSISFIVHFKVFSGKFREALKKELLIFLGIMAASAAGIFFAYGLNPAEIIFHVVSASSGTGFSLWNFSEFGNSLKLLFVALMFIGGMSVSTSGGIKVVRLAVLLKSVPCIINSLLFGREYEVNFDGRRYTIRDVAVNSTFILLGIIIVFLGSIALTTAGFSYMDSLFESASAFGTVGLSTGITTVSLFAHLKWVLIILMLVGRIEIIPFLMTFSRGPERKVHGHEKEGRRLARLAQP